jgi:peptide/nickel transport system permease protein
MWTYAIRRFLYAVPILLGVSMLVFALIHLAPGDVVDMLVPPEVPKEVADSLRARFALDQPIHVQYLAWLRRLLVGDLGISSYTNRPVAEELFQALGNTLLLAMPAALLSFVLGVALGMLGRVCKGQTLRV